MVLVSHLSLKKLLMFTELPHRVDQKRPVVKLNSLVVDSDQTVSFMPKLVTSNLNLSIRSKS